MRFATNISAIVFLLLAMSCSSGHVSPMSTKADPATMPLADTQPPIFARAGPDASGRGDVFDADLLSSQSNQARRTPNSRGSGRRETYEEGDFDLDRVRLDTALMTLSRQAGRGYGVGIDVEWDALEKAGISRDTEVSVHVWSPTLHKALQRIIDSASAGKKTRLSFYADASLIRVDTFEHHLLRDGLTCEYSIRRLLVEVPDVDLLDNKEPAPSTNKTERGQTAWDRREAIITLIKETVDPESWGYSQLAWIRSDKYRLIVRQTEENHRALRNLFEQLEETRSVAGKLDLRVKPMGLSATQPVH